MQLHSRFLFLCIAFITISHCANGQEWTRFRGPNGTGIGNGKAIPTKWTEADYNWKVELPGIGHSCPVVWGDKVFLLSADPETATRYAICINTKDGSEYWSREYKSEPHHLHTRSSFASSTPAVDSERVYMAWSTPKETTLKAFDHAGKEVWSLDLGPWQSQHGFGTSPIIFEDLLILHNSQQANQLKEGEKPGESTMMAFNRKTGAEVWSVPLESMNVCYSVPFIYEPKSGPPELVCTSTGNGMFSLDPRTGKTNWALNDGLFEMRTVASPITVSGLIFGSTGSGRYASNYIVAVLPGKKPEVKYKLKNSGSFKAPYVPCYIAKEDLVFFIYDKGFASCVDAASGKIHWNERVPGNFSGSPVRVDDRIFIVDEDGVVFVFAADKQFKILAQNDLGEPSRSTPAVSGGRLYLRTYSHLISIGGKSS